MRKPECWQAPVIELSEPMAAYLVWLIASDLEGWRTGRESKLTREQATALADYLSEFLPETMRTEVPEIPPMLQAS